jgi:hypothetical protein
MSGAPFYASKRLVYRSPVRNPRTGDLAIGYPIASAMHFVDDTMAQQIAEALNFVHEIAAMPPAERPRGALAKLVKQAKRLVR